MRYLTAHTVSFFFTLCLFFSACSFQQMADSNKRKPNIIVILADDLGYADIAVYGGKAQTPHLDKLADEGLVFTDFHSNGVVCSPTRAALLTGLHEQRLGIEKPLGRVDLGLAAVPKSTEKLTIAEYLEEEGYTTGIFGKWHLGTQPVSNPINFGFDEFRGLLYGDGDYYSKLNRSGELDWWHNGKLQFEEGYTTTLITDNAVRFIEKNHDQPFFLYVPHLSIHFPWQTPDDDKEGFREKSMAYTNNNPGPKSKLGPHSPENVSSVVIRMIQEVDWSVGRIMETLREHELENNTLVFFTSDNGGLSEYGDEYIHGISNNGNLRGQKGQVYEGGHRVPAIAWWPGNIESGGVIHQVATTMDLAPTFLELLEVKPNRSLDGISLVPVLIEGKKLPTRTFFWRHRGGTPSEQKAVRSGPWKLVLPSVDDPPELYNLWSDPSESNNVAENYSRIVEKLLVELNAWEKDVSTTQHAGKAEEKIT